MGCECIHELKNTSPLPCLLTLDIGNTATQTNSLRAICMIHIMVLPNQRFMSKNWNITGKKTTTLLHTTIWRHSKKNIDLKHWDKLHPRPNNLQLLWDDLPHRARVQDSECFPPDELKSLTPVVVPKCSECEQRMPFFGEVFWILYIYIYDSWLYRLTPALSLFQHEKRYILLGKSLEASYASHQDSHGILCLFPGAPWPPAAWSSQLRSRRFAHIRRHQSLRPVDDVGFPVQGEVFVGSKSSNGQFFVVDTPMDLRSLGHTVGEQHKWSPPSPLPFRWGRCWKTSSLLVCREPHRQTILVEHPIIV